MTGRLLLLPEEPPHQKNPFGPTDMAFPLRQRLLRDIAEMQLDPYPRIALHVNDNLTQACLILSPYGQEPLHLTMYFGNYPLQAPVVKIQSKVCHPNVLRDYICASILNTTEGYTPAYTLKSIAIQLLSFFSSESLEQDYGGPEVNLEQYRFARSHELSSHYCVACGFDDEARRKEKPARRIEDYCSFVSSTTSTQTQDEGTLCSTETSNDFSISLQIEAEASEECNAVEMELDEIADSIVPVSHYSPSIVNLGQKFLTLPDDVLLMILSELSDQDLWAVAKVFPVVNMILYSYDFIRVRELQCFCLKDSFTNVRLGVGVHIRRRGLEGTFASEFDLLSQQAYQDYGIRTSVQGLPFKYWLPLPISRRHWRLVREDVSCSLRRLADGANLIDKSEISVIYHFMNDVVVKFSQEAENYFNYDSQSSLTHASEKAVESYFALFHLLLCLATEEPAVVRTANATIHNFLAGHTSKSSCPSLGHLLVAALISDAGMTEQLRVTIIEEAVLRNVVWMLDATGANLPELAYLEPSPVSDYCLRCTFQASKISYCLLMFSALFYKTSRAGDLSLASLRDKIFDAHGAPPRGTAESLASEIRRIKDVDSFPPFLTAMGIIRMPSKEDFTAFLRRMVRESEQKGYSFMPMSQGDALTLRKSKEPQVEVAPGVFEGLLTPKNEVKSFFPNKHDGTRGRGWRGGNGRGRRGDYY